MKSSRVALLGNTPDTPAFSCRRIQTKKQLVIKPGCAAIQYLTDFKFDQSAFDARAIQYLDLDWKIPRLENLLLVDFTILIVSVRPVGRSITEIRGFPAEGLRDFRKIGSFDHPSVAIATGVSAHVFRGKDAFDYGYSSTVNARAKVTIYSAGYVSDRNLFRRGNDDQVGRDARQVRQYRSWHIAM